MDVTYRKKRKHSFIEMYKKNNTEVVYHGCAVVSVFLAHNTVHC